MTPGESDIFWQFAAFQQGEGEEEEVQARKKKKTGGHHLPQELNHPPAFTSFKLIIYSDIFKQSELHQGELLSSLISSRNNNTQKNVPLCANHKVTL